MLNNFGVKSRIDFGVCFTILIVVFGLVSCGSGISDGASSNTDTPIVRLTADSYSIAYNGSANLSWTSTKSTSCTTSSSGSTDTSGSFNTGPLKATHSYTVICYNAASKLYNSDSKTITVAPSVITHFTDAGSGYITVTSDNDLVNGTIVTISGTTHYNGNYTVANVTSTSFVIVAAFNGDDATGNWKLAGGMIGGCSTSATTGTLSAITLSNTPSRFNGVAPLSVFFDATLTSASATTRPFHDLEYRWNFGDPAGSPVRGTTWNSGSRAGVSSRNSATGPVAAHVFETPGVYTVALDVTDGTNTVSNSCAQIVVQDPDAVFVGTNTTCVGATTAPTPGAGGCPTGANAVIQQNFTTAINSYAKTGKRVLFKSGDTFTAATTVRITDTGPGIVGSFGSGALPVIQMTGNTNTLGFSSRSTPTFSDWRIMDLEFNGMGGASSTGVGIDGSSGGISQITTLRLTLRNFETSIGFGGDVINWWNNNPGGAGTTGHNIDQLAIVDSTVVYGANTMYGGYNAGNRVAFMGNNIDNGGNAGGTHVTRFPYLGKAVISNNTLSRPGFDRHTIKLHGPTWVGGVVGVTGDSSNYSFALCGDGYSKQVVISDNKLTDFANPWSIALGPQDGAKDERVKEVILERNLHVSTSTTQVSQYINASEVTSRNNLIMGGGSSSQAGIMVTVRGGEPPANNVRIYNNTQYSADAVPSGQFTMVSLGDSRISNITVKNNLAYAPNALNPLLYVSAGAKNVVVSNNSTNSQVKGTSPNFTATPSVLITNWKPLVPSYAIDAGAVVPVWSDFFGTSRPQNGFFDIGAVEVP